MKVAFAGEAMMELTPDPSAPGHAGLRPAGDVLNSAVYFQRLAGDQAQATFVTALGSDPFSDDIQSFVAGEGIGTGTIRRQTGGQCGLYAVSTSETGERSFSYWRSTSAARSLFSHPADFEAMSGCDVVYLSGITLAVISPPARQALVDWLRDARTGGVRLAFDSNHRPALWEDTETAQDWTRTVWQMADIAFPSVDDEMALFGDPDAQAVLTRFAGYGTTTGALKCGEAGAYVLGPHPRHVPAHTPDQVIDTTAAGDSFNAGFLATYLHGADGPAATAAGAALATHVIQHRGAIVDLPPTLQDQTT